MSSDREPGGELNNGAAGPAQRRPTPIVSFVGRSGSGKTTLLEKVVRELTSRGYRLGVIKHHRHAGVRIDSPGKDTHRFAQAGADHVMLVGPDRAYHMRSYREEPPLPEFASCLAGVDLILTEGYKGADTPKIEVIRGPEEPVLVSDPSQVIAVASDRRLELDLRRFALDEPESLADFIEAHFIAPQPPEQGRKEGS